jgi:regulator of extracellular matrix RemA (YlzA/DUF370 family)
MVSSAKLVVLSVRQRPHQAHHSGCAGQGPVIDASYGRRTRAVLIMNSGHVILSPIQPETIAGRLAGKNTEEVPEDGDEE